MSGQFSNDVHNIRAPNYIRIASYCSRAARHRYPQLSRTSLKRARRNAAVLARAILCPLIIALPDTLALAIVERCSFIARARAYAGRIAMMFADGARSRAEISARSRYIGPLKVGSGGEVVWANVITTARAYHGRFAPGHPGGGVATLAHT